MRASFRRTLFLAPFAPLAVAACASTAAQPLHVSVAPSIVFPQDLLTNATALALTVYDTSTGAACNAATGQTTGVTASTAKIASQSLGTTNCAGGAKFCGALTITQSPDTLVFSAVATGGSGAEVASGCATATVNQDSLSVNITMVRYLTPAVCGDGIIEPTEQCDPPGGTADGGTDLVCDSQCHSKEELLSTTAPSPQGPTALLWPPQSGAQGELLAFFTDVIGGSQSQVGLRVMSDALEAVTAPPAAATAIFAPNGTSAFPPTAASGDQKQPAATFENGTYWYAFNDDSTNGDPDIHLRSFDDSLSAVVFQPINGPGGAGEANVQDAPAIAVGPGGVLLIAWQDVNGPNAGQIMGRTYTPSATAGSPGTLGTENQLSTGSGNENVVLAATATGWIAVFDDVTEVKMRVLGADGTPSGGEIAVSGRATGTQDHPGVAVLGDGRTAVVWCNHAGVSGADIYVQRYDANLTAIGGDQSSPINDVVTAGDQTTPAVAGTSAAGGSFVAAWLDAVSGNVQGRVLDGTSGFDFNPIDGQTTEFQASIATGVSRQNPTVAIGGAGPWVAIGWDDGTGTNVYARRFPTSTQ